MRPGLAVRVLERRERDERWEMGVYVLKVHAQAQRQEKNRKVSVSVCDIAALDTIPTPHRRTSSISRLGSIIRLPDLVQLGTWQKKRRSER